MFRVGDAVKVGEKKGRITFLHDYTTYNGIARGEKTLAKIRFDDGSEMFIDDIYDTNIEKERSKNA